MAEYEQLRVYIQYDILLAADLRYVLGSIEQAYNRVASFFQGTHRIRANNRLQIKSVHTERSIEAFLIGNGRTIVGLFLIFLWARQQHWKTEKLKWDAKLAERKFRSLEYSEGQERIRAAMQNEDVNVVKALQALERVAKRIFQSSRITSIQITLVDEDISPKRSRDVSFEDEE